MYITKSTLIKNIMKVHDCASNNIIILGTAYFMDDLMFLGIRRWYARNHTDDKKVDAESWNYKSKIFEKLNKSPEM